MNPNNSTFIIAEAGVNHNGDVYKAKELVDAAVKAGADAVKFQTFNPDKLVTKKAEKADYQKETTGNQESQYDMLNKLRLGKEEHILLKDYCHDNNIMFMSTPFDTESADFLEDISVEIFKIGSGDLTNHLLLNHLAEKGKPIILSTGMSNLSEVENAVEIIQETNRNIDLSLLHCVSNYPAKVENVNLKAMKTLKEAFKLKVGYSDHTIGDEVPVAAVAMGATIIEKHFTLDKKQEGPDHRASLNPEELKIMIKKIRNIESSFGNGIKKCVPSEKSTRQVARKSLVADKDIAKGEILTRDNTTVKRPEEGIKADKYFEVIDKCIARKDLKEDQVIRWEDILFE